MGGGRRRGNQWSNALCLRDDLLLTDNSVDLSALSVVSSDLSAEYRLVMFQYFAGARMDHTQDEKNLAERPWVVRPKTGYAIRLNIVTDRSIPARWARRSLPAQEWLSGGAAGRVRVVRQYYRARLSAWFLEGGVWQVPGPMRACLEIPFPAQRFSSRRLQMVFSTFTRAWYLLFASTSVQGAADVLVRSTISHTAEAYSSHFSRLRQSSSVIL